MGFFPECWQESYILPFPKPNKDKKIRDNYRPISLTSCLCKTVERMVNERLVWYLEKHKKLDSVQCGFRKHHNTLDHLLRLETYIRKAFVKGEQAVAIFFDLERAYDSTWKYGIKKTSMSWGLEDVFLHLFLILWSRELLKFALVLYFLNRLIKKKVFPKVVY